MKFTRRSFLISAGSIAALSLKPARFLGAATQDGNKFSNLLAFADGEVSHFDEYDAPVSPYLLHIRRSGNAPTISTEHSRSGDKSIKIYLNRSTSSSKFRTELNPIGSAQHDGHDYSMQWGKTYWIGFSIYIPPNWSKSSTTAETLWQIHNRPDDWANSKSPHVVAYINAANSTRSPPDKYSILVRYILTPESENPGNTGIRTAVTDRTQTIYDDIGKWTDWVIEYRPDWRLLSDGGVGVTRIWRDGINFLDYAGPNAYNETKGPYLKLGCYKWDWKNDTIEDPVVERTYYFDEFRMSRPDLGSYELVAPRGTSAAARPEPPNASVE